MNDELINKLRDAANKVERARNSGVTEFLAGWEHQVMREAADLLANLSIQPQHPTDLKPCRLCGYAAKVEIVGPTAIIQGGMTLYLCSQSAYYGGTCKEDAYLSEEAWNNRAPKFDSLPEQSPIHRVRLSKLEIEYDDSDDSCNVYWKDGRYYTILSSGDIFAGVVHKRPVKHSHESLLVDTEAATLRAKIAESRQRFMTIIEEGEDGCSSNCADEARYGIRDLDKTTYTEISEVDKTSEILPILIKAPEAPTEEYIHLIREWLMSVDHPVSQWEKDFALTLEKAFIEKFAGDLHKLYHHAYKKAIHDVVDILADIPRLVTPTNRLPNLGDVEKTVLKLLTNPVDLVTSPSDIPTEAVLEFLTSFQKGVDDWLRPCMGDEITDDPAERNRRFLEEALETVQACDMSRGEAHWMVDYVFNRDKGELPQEVGGAMVCLAALCNQKGINMFEAAAVELKRVWPLMDKIRAKQAAKPRYNPEEVPCKHLKTTIIHTGDGTPVEFCPDCGRNIWTGQAPRTDYEPPEARSDVT